MLSALTRFAAAATLGLASQTAGAGVIWAGNGHEYEVVNAEGTTWTSARTAALALGAGWDLASVTSAAENAFITSILPASPAERSHYWIGATDVAVEGTFAWTDGEAFGYTNWWGGEPNNSNNEDFVAYDFRGTSWAWNDAPDNLHQIFGFARGYIAERRAVQDVPEPATLALLAAALLGLSFRARRVGQ